MDSEDEVVDEDELDELMVELELAVCCVVSLAPTFWATLVCGV